MSYEQFFSNPTYQLIERQLIDVQKNGGDILGSLIPRALTMTVDYIAIQFGGRYSERRNKVIFKDGTSDQVIQLAMKALGNFAEVVDGKNIILSSTFHSAVK